jgi:hypothetical protein
LSIGRGADIGKASILLVVTRIAISEASLPAKLGALSPKRAPLRSKEPPNHFSRRLIFPPSRPPEVTVLWLLLDSLIRILRQNLFLNASRSEAYKGIQYVSVGEQRRIGDDCTPALCLLREYKFHWPRHTRATRRTGTHVLKLVSLGVRAQPERFPRISFLYAVSVFDPGEYPEQLSKCAFPKWKATAQYFTARRDASSLNTTVV